MCDGSECIYIYDHEFEVTRVDDDTIKAVMDAVSDPNAPLTNKTAFEMYMKYKPEPLSTDTFRRIIEMLDAAAESALDNMDFDKAIEYAVMMRECERMMKDE
jgi:hypothetical protein